MKNIIITGTSGLAEALAHNLESTHNVVRVSRSTGHNIQDVKTWGPNFYHYDVCINCAYDQWFQVVVLEQFYYAWRDDPTKQIINIGSSIVDYARIEKEKEYEYIDYRVHKQALQSVFHKLVKLSQCDIKLVNPGAIDTKMIEHLNFDAKMSLEFVAKKIINVMQDPCIKKVDLWL
jgi:short-subunit dehydrogenase